MVLTKSTAEFVALFTVGDLGPPSDILYVKSISRILILRNIAQTIDHT